MVTIQFYFDDDGRVRITALDNDGTVEDILSCWVSPAMAIAWIDDTSCYSEQPITVAASVSASFVFTIERSHFDALPWLDHFYSLAGKCSLKRAA